MRALTVTTSDGFRLAAHVHDTAPSGNAPAPVVPGVLLLHGLSQQRHFWDPVSRRLRSGPVVALDQRAHGDSDVPLGADVSIDACAGDALAALDAAGVPTAVVVGHSWGASVALRAAASAPTRIAACLLLDGGAWGPRDAGPRELVRERLRPPELGIAADDLWAMIATASTPWFGPEARAALEPTFTADAEGRLRTRIGIARHMAVLDGLLDYDPRPDLAAVTAAGIPLIVVSCEERGAPRDLVGLPADSTVLRWEGAVHDVPLQWPSLVAGLIDETVEGLAAREVGA